MEIVVGAGNAKFDAETAETVSERARGLMFSKKKNILFILEDERIFGIHSFFVFFPFDAVYIDGKKKVVDVVRRIAPFTFYVENRKPAKYLLELTQKNKLKIGDKLKW